MKHWETPELADFEIAEIKDAEAIFALQQRAYQSEAELYHDWNIPPLRETLEELKEEFKRQLFLKVVLEGRIVGSVRGRLDKGTCHVGRLIVHPDFQQRGIGTRLLLELEKHCADAKRFELFTGKQSEKNIHLYQQVGYCSFKEQHLSDKVTLVFMEKKISNKNKPA